MTPVPLIRRPSFIISPNPGSPAAQQPLDIDPLLGQCWASVADDGPTLIQHWIDALCWRGVIINMMLGTMLHRWCVP